MRRRRRYGLVAAIVPAERAEVDSGANQYNRNYYTLDRKLALNIIPSLARRSKFTYPSFEMHCFCKLIDDLSNLLRSHLDSHDGVWILPHALMPFIAKNF